MENPWGEPSSPPLASASAPTADGNDTKDTRPRLSLEAGLLHGDDEDEDDDPAAWDAQDSPVGQNDDAWADEARASRPAQLPEEDVQEQHEDTLKQDDAERQTGEAPTSPAEGEADPPQPDEPTSEPEPQAAADDVNEVTEEQEDAQPTIAAPDALAVLSEAETGPPMDDFPDDDDTTDEPPAPSFGAADDDAFGATSNDDDFDDFGAPADAGAPGSGAGDDNDDDDFGDFGDFGDAAPLDTAVFDDVPATAAALTSPPTPVASTSTTPASYPPLRFDLTDPSRQAISSQLHDFWEGAFPMAARAVNDDPERQVEGAAQVLVTESSRQLWSELSTLPPLRPVDWRRSRIRREHLLSMGFSVSQEEETPLPSMAAISSPNPHFPAPARPSSAPPPASAARLQEPGRPSTPLGTSSPTNGTPSASRTSLLQRSAGPGGYAPTPPSFDRARAERALSVAEEDLSLRSLSELRDLDAELDRISVEASELLTHALMRREKESQDKEVYDGMIQDLVIAAAKMKTSSAVSASAGKEPKRSGSGRWKLGK